MRCTIVLAALVAHALAQVLPITQISDGQIQAPPPTSAFPAPVSGSTEVIVIPSTGVPVPIPTVSETVVLPPVSGTLVIPVPSGSETLIPIPVPTNGTVPTTSGTFSNSTASVTGRPTGSGTAPPAATTTSPPGNNGAGTNMISFGGIALAVAALVLA